MGDPDNPDQVLIALEPEAASIYCRKLKMNQLVPERPISRVFGDLKKDPDSLSTCSDFVLEDSGTGNYFTN